MKLLDEFFFNIHDTNSIVTGGIVKEGKEYCPVGCKFCICKGDKTDVGYKIPFITEKQFEQGLKFITWNKKKEIMLGDGISRLSAEAFAHPKIYKFLDRLCHLFPEHNVCIITTGIFIKENKIDFLNSLKNLHLSISVNTLDPELRPQIMPSPRTEHIKTLIKELERASIGLFDMGDTDILKRDIEELAELRSFDEGIQLRRLEHTKYHGKEAIEMSMRSIANFENSLKYIIREWPQMKHWSPYVEYLMHNLEARKDVMKYVKEVAKYCMDRRSSSVLLCMAESSYRSWKRWLETTPNAHPILVKNNTYGGSVTNAGLLLFDDIRIALKDVDLSKVNRILVPQIMLNKAYQDLSQEFLIDFEREVGIATTVI